MTFFNINASLRSFEHIHLILLDFEVEKSFNKVFKFWKT